MTAEIEVLQPGLFSTIQDSGRFGFRDFGVPLSGPMDTYASRLGNLILQNSPQDAVLEITQIGPRLKFFGSANIVITGARLSPKINEEFIYNNRIYGLTAGDILSFGIRETGARAYLALQGGFICDEVLGSCCWFEGLTPHFRLEKGMKLKYLPDYLKESTSRDVEGFRDSYMFTNKVPVYPGPEFYKLPASFQKLLSNTVFSLDSSSNRMAIQLNEKLENNLDPIITVPVIPGTVQLTPSGKLIILMRDCQTTGGYPRVLQVSGEGLNILAQKIMGDKIEFELLQLL